MLLRIHCHNLLRNRRISGYKYQLLFGQGLLRVNICKPYQVKDFSSFLFVLKFNIQFAKNMLKAFYAAIFAGGNLSAGFQKFELPRPSSSQS